MAKAKTPAVEGWFTTSDAPALLGTRCGGCGTYFFPKETVVCRNPRCFSTELEEVELSRRGRVWSFTNNCYPPPEPYVAPDPFEPYAIAAVELEDEKMVVLGQMADGIGVELDAKSSGGRVHSDFDVSGGRTTKTAMSGAVNGGGPELYLRSSGGGVKIERR